MDLVNPTYDSLPDSRDYAQIVAEYQRLRAVSVKLNNAIVKTLSGDVIDEGAKKLGMLHRGTIVFKYEDESCVLMDYCIYNVLSGGRNAVEQFIANTPPAPDSDEMVVLRAAQQAVYTILSVQRAVPGVGCIVRNLCNDQVRLLADIGFSRSASDGAVLATRILDFGRYIATCGASLPVGVIKGSELAEWKRRFFEEMGDFGANPAALIRTIRRLDGSSRIRYEEVETDSRRRKDPRGGIPTAQMSTERTGEFALRRGSHVDPSRRCRCGSGKMYKNCCGKR